MESPYKKPCCNSLDTFSYPNFSTLLTQPFELSNNRIKAYFYVFTDVSGFGIFFPIQYIPLPPFLTEFGVKTFSSARFDMLKSFQNIFWCDLFHVKPSGFEISAANYLIAPVKTKNISWKSVSLALKQLPPTSLCKILPSKCMKTVVIEPSSNIMYYYIAKVTNNSNFLEILSKLQAKSLYSQEIPEAIEEEILKKTEELIKSAVLSNPLKPFSLILCRLTKPIRRAPTKTKPSITPGTLRLIPESSLQAFYLSRNQLEFCGVYHGLSKIWTVSFRKYFFVVG